MVKRNRKPPTPEYLAWAHMKDRCSNPRTPGYERYGGRGISVCHKWRESFHAFLKDVGPRPAGMSLERIDNSRNYEPGNVRWATKREQQQNTRRNRFVTIGNTTLCISEWARRLGVCRFKIRDRLNRGMSPEEALGPWLNQLSIS